MPMTHFLNPQTGHHLFQNNFFCQLIFQASVKKKKGFQAKIINLLTLNNLNMERYKLPFFSHHEAPFSQFHSEPHVAAIPSHAAQVFSFVLLNAVYSSDAPRRSVQNDYVISAAPFLSLTT